MVDRSPDSPSCPDGGFCHHECEDKVCFRVQACAPLSGVYPDNKWPWSVKHQPIEDWVPDRKYWSRDKELRAVYCTCGSDDYAECVNNQLFDGADWERIRELTKELNEVLMRVRDE